MPKKEDAVIDMKEDDCVLVNDWITV